MPKHFFNTEKNERLISELKVKRSIEKTDKYDEEIKTLEAELDFVHWGIK